MIELPAVCPLRAALEHPDLEIAPRPPPTVKQIFTAALAMTSGRKVSLEVMRARNQICLECDQQKLDEKNERWCEVCGCDTSSDNRKLLNLTAYEENLPHWGCKHPRRGQLKNEADPAGPRFGWPNGPAKSAL